MSSVLQPYVDRGELAGAVALVADAKKVLKVECVGWADIAARQPMKPNTLFWIASQTKPMTSTAITMLIDEGKVGVDDPVEKYLPEFKGLWLAVERDDAHVLLKKPSRAITVGDILSHTSGMPFASPMETPTLDLLTLREWRAVLRGHAAGLRAWRNISIPTPGSTRPGGSSRSSAECPTRSL